MGAACRISITAQKSRFKQYSQEKAVLPDKRPNMLIDDMVAKIPR